MSLRGAGGREPVRPSCRSRLERAERCTDDTVIESVYILFETALPRSGY
jgi:hypothetical protein